MYPLSRRRVPGIVSLGLTLILLGLLLALISLWRLQTAAANAEHARSRPAAAPATAAPAPVTPASSVWLRSRDAAASPTL